MSCNGHQKTPPLALNDEALGRAETCRRIPCPTHPRRGYSRMRHQPMYSAMRSLLMVPQPQLVWQCSEHLTVGNRYRRCWTCAAWVDANLPHGAQPLGECTRVDWRLNGHRQMAHSDDVWGKFVAAFGSVGQME